jgi:hypothetical protein
METQYVFWDGTLFRWIVFQRLDENPSQTEKSWGHLGVRYKKALLVIIPDIRLAYKLTCWRNTFLSRSLIFPMI